MAKEKGLRTLRLGEDIKHILSTLISRGEMRDPSLLDVSITISEVRVSPDLSYATVFVMPLGGGDIESVLAGLKRGKGFLRREIGKRIKARLTPDLVFKADNSFEYSSKMETLFHDPKVAKDLSAPDVEEDELD
jgi:ribosome-binding factor A